MNKIHFSLKTATLLAIGLWLMVTSWQVNAQYAVSDIPDSLVNDKTVAVIRNDYARFEMTSISSAVYTTKMAVTIFKEDADYLAKLTEHYDPNLEVEIRDAGVYNSYGQRIYKLKRRDIIDQKVATSSLLEDNRVKRLDLSQNRYPYTIEFEVEREYSYIYFIPDWYVFPGEHMAVENSSVEILASPELMPRVKEFNIPAGAYEESQEEGKVLKKWTFQQLKALDKYYYGKKRLEHHPIIYFAPSEFEFSGYAGNMSNWDDYARWINLLNEGKNDLSEADKAKVKSLVAGVEDDKEKIRIIYDYLQKNTRYVSIQLGIGGFQPFPASYVSENGYGDCKALSFYTKSMLEVVGIKSNYTLVSAGPNPRPILKDFPFSNFNHAILMVPNKGDTVWLECTSQTAPFNYMGNFTGDRDVFVIQEDGGAIVRTPAYGENENLEVNKLDVVINEDGTANASLHASLSGLYSERNGLNFRYHQNESDKRQWVMRNSPFKDFDLKKYSMQKDSDNKPHIDVKSEYKLRGFSRMSGKRIFFGVNPFQMNYDDYRKELGLEKEDDQYIVNKGFTKSDEILITFPERLAVEHVPESVSIKTDFGEYELQFEIEQGKLKVTRKLLVKRQIVDADQSEDFSTFLNKIINYDDPKVVLRRTT